mgnify:CR=1 FL=1
MKAKRPTKTQILAMCEIYDKKFLAVPSSRWTTGSGRYTKSRAVPPFCEKINREDREKYPRRISRMFDANPRCRSVVAVVDVRGANAAISRVWGGEE